MRAPAPRAAHTSSAHAFRLFEGNGDTASQARILRPVHSGNGNDHVDCALPQDARNGHRQHKAGKCLKCRDNAREHVVDRAAKNPAANPTAQPTKTATAMMARPRRTDSDPPASVRARTSAAPRIASEHMPLATWRCQGSRQFRSVHIKGNSKRKQDEHCDIRKHHAHHDKKTRTRRTSTHDSSSSSDVDRSAGRRHRSMH